MKANRLILASALAALTCACVSERRPAPTPQPSPRPAPVPRPVAPPPADWRDVPLTPGDWSYRPEGVTSAALYGAPGTGAMFIVRCNRASRTMTLARAGAAAQTLTMNITTTSQAKGLGAAPVPGQPPYVVANLPASDPLLDAMAFSRGRFRVEVAGMPTLTLPAWPEIGRAIEDCR